MLFSQHYLRPRAMDRLWFMAVRYWRIIPRISSIFTSSVRLICFHIISELPNQSFDWSSSSGMQLFDPLIIGLLPYHLPRHCILNSKQSLYTQVPPPACLRLFMSVRPTVSPTVHWTLMSIVLLLFSAVIFVTNSPDYLPILTLSGLQRCCIEL